MSSRNSQADSMDDDEVSPTNPTDNDCKQLFKVAKQLAAPPDVIIKTLVKKTPKQRQQTKERFKEMYDLELVPELKEGLGPEWHLLIDALLTDSTSSGAKKLHDALEGLKEDSGKVDEKTAGKDAEQLNEATRISFINCFIFLF
ncbi:Hypothetical predicted protein [Mytilus galloprovincialis]|uniref:Uncharacterized protein n=1 Tax=Mytilus galloprovincialis TaxID=29158 RepID=A0A8B6HQH0_MYTGA|nr:Hypothetical predicted protein [Mytilus galloprovincialis]